MVVQAFEDNQDFGTLCRIAEPYVGERWALLHWLVHVLCHAMGRLSVYDYAARVSLARERLGDVKTQHREAARIALERIVINLVPHPDTVAAAARGTPSAEVRTGSDFEGLVPLDDESITNDALARERHETLARAFSLYCEVLFESTRADMEDEDLPEFEKGRDDLLHHCNRPAEKAREIRKALYLDFPDDRLNDFSEEMSEDRDDEFTVRDRIRGTPRQMKMEQELETAEREIQRHLRAILNAAREARTRLMEIEKRYQERMTRLDYFKCAVAPNLDKDVQSEIEEKVAGFTKEIRQAFDPKTHLPAEVLSDLTARRKLYRGGRL
jgi:hypothetical protein